MRPKPSRSHEVNASVYHRNPPRPAREPRAPRALPAAPPEAFYPIRGVVKGVAADRQSVTLDHEEIPGFMPRMEMEYVVADRALLDGVEPGDRVEGELRMRGRGLSIVRLHKRRP